MSETCERSEEIGNRIDLFVHEAFCQTCAATQLVHDHREVSEGTP